MWVCFFKTFVNIFIIIKLGDRKIWKLHKVKIILILNSCLTSSYYENIQRIFWLKGLFIAYILVFFNILKVSNKIYWKTRPLSACLMKKLISFIKVFQFLIILKIFVSTCKSLDIFLVIFVIFIFDFLILIFRNNNFFFVLVFPVILKFHLIVIIHLLSLWFVGLLSEILGVFLGFYFLKFTLFHIDL